MYKVFIQKRYKDSVRFVSVALCALDTSCILCLTPSVLFLCVIYYVRVLVYHSIYELAKSLREVYHLLHIYLLITHHSAAYTF